MKRFKLAFATLLLCLLMVFPAYAYQDPYYPNDGDWGDLVIYRSHSDYSPTGEYFTVCMGNFSNGYLKLATGVISDDYKYELVLINDGLICKQFYRHKTLEQALAFVNGLKINDANGSSSNSKYCDVQNCVVYSTVPIYSDSSGTTLLQDINYGPDGPIAPIPKTNYVYDSSIPAPQNLYFKASAEGGIPIVHIGGKNYHTLTWTNADVEQYGVRISAVIVATDDQQNSVEKEILVCSDGSDGSDLGYRASNKFFKYNFTDFWDIVADETGYGIHMESLNLKQYRVQFYQYVSGVQQVGPVGVVGVKRNFFGSYSGNSVTTEFPLNSEDIGLSGGLYDSDSSDKWSSENQPYVDYDAFGNQSATGTVGKGEDVTGNGNPLSTIQDIISGLINLPTVISQFFSSLKNMFTGLGDFPSLLSAVFSFLPPELLAFIGLGIMLVVVLRIVGR